MKAEFIAAIIIIFFLSVMIHESIHVWQHYQSDITYVTEVGFSTNLSGKYFLNLSFNNIPGFYVKWNWTNNPTVVEQQYFLNQDRETIPYTIQIIFIVVSFMLLIRKYR